MNADSRQKSELVASAMAATTKAFLTKEGGTRYGAAVLTASGRIYSSGQYSSFNHSTNIHAEQAALVMATENGDTDVLMLAVASNTNPEYTRPCGVCRQFMLEHATRSHRDFVVLMVRNDGSWEEAKVSELIPLAWQATSQPRSDDVRQAIVSNHPGQNLSPDGPMNHSIRTGDQVLLGKNLIAIIWDSDYAPGKLLLKIKYRRLGNDRWTKLPHAFSDCTAYEQSLDSIPNLTFPHPGAKMVIADINDVTQVFPSKNHAPLPHTFGECLDECGLQRDSVFLGGSRATGFSSIQSDYDWVVRTDATKAEALVHAISERLKNGTLTRPAQSRTWQVINAQYPGGYNAIIGKGVYASTFGENNQSHSLMFCPSDPEPPLMANSSSLQCITECFGTVAESTSSIFKRARFSLELPNGMIQQVVCYHKTGHLVRKGDKVAVRGWRTNDPDESLIIQFQPIREGIVWFQ